MSWNCRYLQAKLHSTSYLFGKRLIRLSSKKVGENSREYHNNKPQPFPDTALPRHQEEEETDKTKQAQIEQTYEKH